MFTKCVNLKSRKECSAIKPGVDWTAQRLAGFKLVSEVGACVLSQEQGVRGGGDVVGKGSEAGTGVCSWRKP